MEGTFEAVVVESLLQGCGYEGRRGCRGCRDVMEMGIDRTEVQV